MLFQDALAIAETPGIQSDPHNHHILKMSSQSGPNSGGDLFDMAKDGTKVPESAAEPRLIPSKPRPDQVASSEDPNQLGAADLAGAATNSDDIPRASPI